MIRGCQSRELRSVRKKALPQQCSCSSRQPAAAVAARQ
jgi:hypothetical protein